MNPQNASNAEIGRPIFDTDIGTEKGPICTGHRVNSLQRWPNATAAKIEAETAAFILPHWILGHRAMCPRSARASNGINQLKGHNCRRDRASPKLAERPAPSPKEGAPDPREDSGAPCYDALGRS